MQLVIENISKSFGRKNILNQINLRISSGSFGLLGPNGAGKTTLMRLLATILKPDSGNIRMGNFVWSKHPDAIRQIIGYLPQNFGVFRNVTAAECLDYIASLKGIRHKNERRNQIEAVLGQVNLTDERKTKVGHFSGGMKRRLGIAQALLGNPKMIMVDEPTAGLDPEERIRFRNLLREISLDRIVLISTHIVEDITATCDGVAVLHKGSATQFDSLSRLADAAKHKVWSLRVTHDGYKDLQSKGYKIISTRMQKEYVETRILSIARPAEHAELVEPTVEEGYLAWIGR